MNYTRFLEEFVMNSPFGNTGNLSAPMSIDSRGQLLKIFGNTTTSNWAYRIFSKEMAALFTEILEWYFEEYTGRVEVFASVWNGILLAEDKNNKEQVLLFEPESAQVFEVPGNLDYFHNIQLVENRWPILREHLYVEWTSENKSIPGLRDCIGYKKPLFLGGLDSISNLEIIDMEVYWTVTGQLWNSVKNLPPWTSIWDVSISE